VLITCEFDRKGEYSCLKVIRLRFCHEKSIMDLLCSEMVTVRSHRTFDCLIVFRDIAGFPGREGSARDSSRLPRAESTASEYSDAHLHDAANSARGLSVVACRLPATV
jgi:hypothetical protein